MQFSEIQILNHELSVRGLKAVVKEIIRQKRPTCSEDTFSRAWNVSDWDRTSPLLREILTCGQTILNIDDQRLAQMKAEPSPN